MFVNSFILEYAVIWSIFVSIQIVGINIGTAVRIVVDVLKQSTVDQKHMLDYLGAEAF